MIADFSSSRFVSSIRIIVFSEPLGKIGSSFAQFSSAFYF